MSAAPGTELPPGTPIAHERLRDFATRVYEHCGLPAEDAALCADTLVQADLWGHQSHGVMRLSWYTARLRRGVSDALARPQTVVDAGAIAVLDGCDAMGQVAAVADSRQAVQRAKRHGIGAVAVRHSNHFGTAFYYTLMAAREHCVAFLCTNASPAMAPWGGRHKAVGTNPWSWASPAGRHDPMVLDIANTSVARGKIYLARQKGLKIPAGWALDAQGAPTIDPAAAIDGVILPMAEHKGYAIAVIMDMLSGVLSGSAFGQEVHGPYQSERRSGAGHLMIVLDIEKFLPLIEFNQRQERLIAELKAVPLARGSAEILYPGEIEARNDRRHRAQGLVLPDNVLSDLQAQGELAGLDFRAMTR